MADSLFIPAANGRGLEPTEHARGPWDPNALHGGAPAALIARAFERMQPGAELPIARLGFEFLKPIPFAELEMSTKIVRNGRRVQELAAELTTASGGGALGDELIGRASALRIQAVPEGLPDPDDRREQPGPEPIAALAGPEQGKVVKFALNDPDTTSLASTGMEMSWLTDPWSLGPGRVWMRLRQPIVPGEEATPLVRLVATADFGNGISAELPFDEYLFINADLTIHLWRRPRGEWIGLDAKTVLMDGGVGTAESVLHDADGPVGRASQTLVVQPR
jgi:Thioesterase-like superfamily